MWRPNRAYIRPVVIVSSSSRTGKTESEASYQTEVVLLSTRLAKYCQWWVTSSKRCSYLHPSWISTPELCRLLFCLPVVTKNSQLLPLLQYSCLGFSINQAPMTTVLVYAWSSSFLLSHHSSSSGALVPSLPFLAGMQERSTVWTQKDVTRIHIF